MFNEIYSSVMKYLRRGWAPSTL